MYVVEIFYYLSSSFEDKYLVQIYRVLTVSFRKAEGR